MSPDNADEDLRNQQYDHGSVGFYAVKRLALVVAIVSGGASLALGAAAPATLTNLHAITALSNVEASKALPVAFEATVTFARLSERTLFVQDDNVAIYVNAPENAKLLPGDRVLVVGRTKADFSTDVIGDRVEVLRHGELPQPIPATFDELIKIQHDCMFVFVHAVVRSADVEMRSDMRDPKLPMHPVARAQLLMDGGYIEAFIDGADSKTLSGMLDAEVEVTGVAGQSFDGKMQPTGAQIYVSSLADVRVLNRAETSAWSLPVTPMNQFLTGFHVNDLTSRIRIHGTITYYQPGSAVVIQDGTNSMWITTKMVDSLQIGDRADAIGFPEAHNGLLALTRAEIRDTHIQAPIKPLPVTWKQLTASGNLYDLVSIEGKVVEAVREASQDEYVLNTGGQMFTAIYRHPGGILPPMKQIPVGASVRVAGICILEGSNPFNGEVPFDILLRSFDDIEMVKRPSLLNVQNLVIMVGLLLVVVAVVGARGWALERKVRRQTAVMSARNEVDAVLERQRSRVLEDINGSQPLASILEKIVELTSFSLDGAPCWCEVADGSTVGDCLPEPHGLRIAHANVDSRSGPALGALFVALPPETPPAAREDKALSNGARLATLAIETRRLYSDLRRRSEFDLLTDIYNRFSLHKRLDVLIQEAGSGGIFGLIYLDLDKFKPINDTFGHHVGDSSLQEVAMRMNDQLLGGDMLARLGGDEFAALVSLQRGRSDLNRIVDRLQGCFDAPFVIEGHTIKGSASIGTAVYPEDGATKDALLNAADDAMYAAKNSKRQITDSSAQKP